MATRKIRGIKGAYTHAPNLYILYKLGVNIIGRKIDICEWYTYRNVSIMEIEDYYRCSSKWSSQADKCLVVTVSRDGYTSSSIFYRCDQDVNYAYKMVKYPVPIWIKDA